MTSVPKISLKNVFKVFGERPEKALAMVLAGRSKAEIHAETGCAIGVNDASFTIKDGEIFVIMGLSGSGKSTLLRLLNRLIEPTSGSIAVDGRDLKIGRESFRERVCQYVYMSLITVSYTKQKKITHIK